VKSLLVYASDQSGEGMEKKTKVSVFFNVFMCYYARRFYSQRIRREIKICARLQHKNILPIFGYTYGFGLLMAIVHPWAENGNLTMFLEREHSALRIVRRFKIVSLPAYACELQTDGDTSS
jgi:serine/threonine protein kinase